MPANLPGRPGENSGIVDISEDPELNFTLPAEFLGAPEPFLLKIDVDGWEKQIFQPDGDVIIIAPRQEVTLTNLDTGEAFTTNISGSTHRDYHPDGTYTDTYVGRHLNFDPEAGFVLIAGHFVATYAADGTVLEELSGSGRITSVWDELL